VSGVATGPYSVLITGAASGIGLALAEHLLRSQHRVIATDRDAHALAAARSRMNNPANLRTVTLDVAELASIDRAMAAVAADPPAVLINNAGLQHVAALEEYPPEKWQYLISVMLTGAAMLTRAVLPGMRTRGFGRIVNIGSIHALVASPFKSAYVAAKHGLVGFSKVIALETADTEITINTVCPTYVKTPLVDAQMEALAQKHSLPVNQVAEETMLRPMPKHRFIEMDELAGIVEFLMGNAARNITGQCITVDGGWTAQ
jgi:3-hydroxybutyrate dehydrogenase